MDTWKYYVVYNGIGGSAENPDTIARIRDGDPDAFAQIFDRYGQWRRSMIFVDIFLGKGTHETVPISRDEAVAFVHDEFARGLRPSIPDDLQRSSQERPKWWRRR